MAIFRVQYLKKDGVSQVRLVEADWQADVEREIQQRGHRLLSIEHVQTAADRPSGMPSQKAHGGFWTFRRFVTPSWICSVFIFNVVIVAMIAGYSIYSGVSALLAQSPGMHQRNDAWTFFSLAATLAISFLYLFSLRIVLECVIVLFRIYDELVSCGRNLRARASQ